MRKLVDLRHVVAPLTAELIHLADRLLDLRLHHCQLLLPAYQLARLIHKGSLRDGDVIEAQFQLVLDQLKPLQCSVPGHRADFRVRRRLAGRSAAGGSAARRGSLPLARTASPRLLLGARFLVAKVCVSHQTSFSTSQCAMVQCQLRF